MARPVVMRNSYTGERSRLSRLEMAIEKDPRLLPDLKAKAAEKIRCLVQALMELDSALGPLSVADSATVQRLRKRA